MRQATVHLVECTTQAECWSISGAQILAAAVRLLNPPLQHRKTKQSVLLVRKCAVFARSSSTGTFSAH